MGGKSDLAPFRCQTTGEVFWAFCSQPAQDRTVYVMDPKAPAASVLSLDDQRLTLKETLCLPLESVIAKSSAGWQV